MIKLVTGIFPNILKIYNLVTFYYRFLNKKLKISSFTPFLNPSGSVSDITRQSQSLNNLTMLIPKSLVSLLKLFDLFITHAFDITWKNIQVARWETRKWIFKRHINNNFFENKFFMLLTFCTSQEFFYHHAKRCPLNLLHVRWTICKFVIL